MKPWLRLFLLGVGLFVPAVVRAQLPPEKMEATFTVSDGLEMKLFAAEPLLVNPTSMDIDHKGRVWVTEAVNYRTKMHRRPLFRPSGDRIVILEDTRGTGKADKSTIFYQGTDLYGPLGIAVAKDPVGPGWKVYVCQSPDILLFEDKDGDGKADGPPKKLLTGFGGFDHDHGVHGILIGPDNRLYFSVGDTGVHGLQSSDGKGRKWHSNNVDVRAGTIWRCDLDGKNVELIAHNFRNEYEPCVDSFGTVFVSDNDDDGNQQTRICYVMPGGNYGYHATGKKVSHWNEEIPGVVPKILRTGFGSPTGICVYEGTLLPKKYWGQLLHTDAGPRHVRCYHLTPKGAGYDVEREDMVTSTDNWFRPSDICVAPDGSVFVADWYDPGVGGHGMGDTTRGRIYRITPKGHKGYKVPKYNLKSDELFDALASPNRAVRYMAMQVARKAFREPVALPEGTCLFYAAPKQTDRVKYLKTVSMARALSLAADMGWWESILSKQGVAGDFNKFLEAVDIPPSDNMVFALLRPLFRRYPDLTKLPKKVTDDLRTRSMKSSPAVRREFLLALRTTDPQLAKDWILDLAGQYDGKDRFYLEAIGIAVGHNDQKRREIILADFDKQFPEWNAKVADLVWELRPPKALPMLQKRLVDANVPAADRARIVDIVATSEDASAGKALLHVLQSEAPPEVRERVIENLKLFLPNKWSGLRQSEELKQAITVLLTDASSRPTGLALIGVAQKFDAIERVAELAGDAKQSEAVRRAAVQTLGALPATASVQALEKLLRIHNAAVRSETVQALGQLARQHPGAAGTKPALSVLQEIVGNDKADLTLRLAAVSALAGSRPGTGFLLELHKQGKLATALTSETARLLRNSPYPDLRNRALIAFAPNRLNPRKLPPMAVLLARKGDPVRGQKVLAASTNNDMQCLKCHTVQGIGGQVGPDLSVIGKKASKENLFESILSPSKAIADQFLQWTIETTKGEVVAGLIVEETPTSITLRDGNGKDTKISKKNIESRTKSSKSLMPEDLLAYMTEDDLVDLVAYLFTLKTPALGMDYFHILGPFDSGGTDASMDKALPPEKKVDLKESYKGKSGMVHWRTVKPDAKGYYDLQSFFAPESSNIISYLYREVESPADQDVTIQLGADDCANVWINGQLVHHSRDHAAASPGQYTIRARLHKGTNKILIKINNGEGPHGLYFLMLAEQEVKRLASK